MSVTISVRVRCSPSTRSNLQAGLSPAIVLVGEAEIPRDDIRTFAKRLREAGVDVTLHEAVDMPHNGAFFADYHASAE